MTNDIEISAQPSLQLSALNVESSEVVSLTAQNEISSQDNNIILLPSTTSRLPKRSRCFTITYYVSLSAIALILTIVSKGTKLWKTDSKLSSERGELNIHELKLLFIHYLAVLISFYFVQGSDPGYLTTEVMNRVSQRDGLSILGEIIAIDNNQNDEENERNNNMIICEPATSTIEMDVMTNKNEVTRRSNFTNEVLNPSINGHDTAVISRKRMRRKICQVSK